MISRQLNECPYRPSSKFSLDIFLSYLNRLKISNYQLSESEKSYIILLDKMGIKKLAKLFEAIDYRYSFLDKLRSSRDYEIVLSYENAIKNFTLFNKVEQFQLKSQDTWFAMSSNGPYYLTNHSLGLIDLTNKETPLNPIWNSSRYRFLSISNTGLYSIIKSKSKYLICENKTRKLSTIDSLSVDKNYVFIFNNTDKNFASLDQDGQFTYFSITNQPLIKIKLDIDSYLSIKHIFESRHIITDEAIYNFSGDKVHSGSDKYVFHYYDNEIMVRENLFSQKLEVVLKNKQISKFDIYYDRLIYRIRIINNRILLVVYEDELIEFINIYTNEKLAVFTPEKIMAISCFENYLMILLSSNILQIVELNN